MQFHRNVLSNGARVIVIPMPSFESATAMVMIGAGSRYETKKNNGISHFLEHMAFKGTKKRPTALSISTLIDGIGGEFNAFTGKEVTGYYIKSAANHIDLSLDVLSDMLQNSLFDPKEIDKERNVIVEEINLYEDTPARKIGDIYEQLLYGDTPMGWDVSGEKDIILKIQREDFIEYLVRLYSADNLTMVIAGGVNEENALMLSEKYFGQMKKFPTKKFEPVVESQKESKVLVREKKTEQAHLALGVRTVPLDHKHRYALSILAAVLGGGMSSRLFHEVREKRGLAYYVRTSSDHNQDCGSLVSVAGVDSKRIEEAIKVIREEYEKIQSSEFKVQNDELKKAKEFLKGHMVLELEDSRAVAGFYASQELLEKKIETPDEVLEKINEITEENIAEVAKLYLTPKGMNLAVIGNFSSEQVASGQNFKKLLS